MQIDPIIAVKDVEESSKWYRAVFGFTSMHGGSEFDVLLSKEGKISLCLHKWGAHEHPTMQHPDLVPGNGLILYFRTRSMEEIRQNLRALNYPVAEEVGLNPNSLKREFSLRDPDGYYLTISEFHEFAG